MHKMWLYENLVASYVLLLMLLILHFYFDRILFNVECFAILRSKYCKLLLQEKQTNISFFVQFFLRKYCKIVMIHRLKVADPQ